MVTTASTSRPTVLIDSNVFIAAEEHGGESGHVHGKQAAKLLQLVERLGFGLLISQGTRSDLVQAPEPLRSRRRRALDKYVVMEAVPENPSIRSHFPASLSSNDAADLEVLTSHATGRSAWLVTEDRRLRSRAAAAGFDDVISLADALQTLGTFAGDPIHLSQPGAEQVPAYTVSTRSSIFESLRNDYSGFDQWWRQSVVRTDRPVIVMGDSADPAGIAVLKSERDGPYGLPDPVLKICTFKIADNYQGAKRGEALLKACIEHARAIGHATMYLEVLPDKEDLIIWLGQFGFSRVEAEASQDQIVFRKDLHPPLGATPLLPLDHAVAYGPGSLLLERVHVVPIQDRYHQMLFPDADRHRQDPLFGGTAGCGNAIRKAYLCHAPTRKVQPGDGLLFVRTGAGPATITAVGVTESVLVSRDPNEVTTYVGTRTVYSHAHIEAQCAYRDVLVLMFRHDRALRAPVSIQEAKEARVLVRTPQSIAEMERTGIEWLKPLLGA
ncbi:MAG: GNAT family N-acetyltransferase [Nocardioides sp.]